MVNKTQLEIATIAILSALKMSYAETIIFDEVVVSATRTEQSKKDSSSSIETVSADDVNTSLAVDMKQALKHTPGVQVDGSGRFGISGFNIRGVEGSRVKMTVDGIQQPSPYNPGANEQRKYSNMIEVDTLQSIEVNKGPSSTLYGSDALGGVVLLRTKNPQDILVTEQDENRFGIKSSYSSANEQFKNTLTWAMREDKLETLLMLTYADGNETKTHGSGADIEGPDRGAANPADTQLGNVLAKAYYQFNEDHRFGFAVEYYDKQYDEDELNYNGYTLSPGFTYSDNHNQDDNKRLRLSFEHEMLMDSTVADSLDWSVSYQDSSSLSKNYDTTTVNGKRLRERDSSDKSVQLDSQLSKLFMVGDNSHEFTYGATYLQNEFKLQNLDYNLDTGSVNPGATAVPDATVTQWGLYAQNQTYQMEERLVITTGLRFDSFKTAPEVDAGSTNNYSDNSDTAFTGKLGSVYHFNRNLSLFGQISQGFKAPTVSDLYYFYSHGAIIEPNPNLKAEKSLAYELGLRGGNDYATFELTSFYNDYRDFITSEKIGTDAGRDVYTKTNLDKVKIYGVELNSEFDLDTMIDAPHGTYSRISVAYVDGEDERTGKTLDSIAPLTGVLAVGIDRDNYGSAIDWKMVAGKDEWLTEDNVNVPGYAVVDVTAYYKPINDLTISGGLFNVFDKKYWLFSDLSGRDMTSNFNIDGKSQPGRNWGISVDYQF